jgi:hypothetical protein
VDGRGGLRNPRDNSLIRYEEEGRDNRMEHHPLTPGFFSPPHSSWLVLAGRTTGSTVRWGPPCTPCSTPTRRYSRSRSRVSLLIKSLAIGACRLTRLGTSGPCITPSKGGGYKRGRGGKPAQSQTPFQQNVRRVGQCAERALWCLCGAQTWRSGSTTTSSSARRSWTAAEEATLGDKH